MLLYKRNLTIAVTVHVSNEEDVWKMETKREYKQNETCKVLEPYEKGRLEEF